VRADTRDALFGSAARALTEVMVDRRTLVGREARRIDIASPTLDRLLYDFLTELIVMKDVDSLLFKDFKVAIARGRGGTGEGAMRLVCDMRGEEIDRERHDLRNDVKAVTMHLFGVRQRRREAPPGREKRWEATVVLDI
jgi:SHS2 domain-containing protein